MQFHRARSSREHNRRCAEGSLSSADNSPLAEEIPWTNTHIVTGLDDARWSAIVSHLVRIRRDAAGFLERGSSNPVGSNQPIDLESRSVSSAESSRVMAGASRAGWRKCAEAKEILVPVDLPADLCQSLARSDFLRHGSGVRGDLQEDHSPVAPSSHGEVGCGSADAAGPGVSSLVVHRSQLERTLEDGFFGGTSDTGVMAHRIQRRSRPLSYKCSIY